MGPLGQCPAARRALGAGHIPALERALDLRRCTLGPQLPPPPSLPPGPPPPCADVAAVNQSAPAAPPGRGARGSPGSTGPRTPSPERASHSPTARLGALPAALGPRRPGRAGSPAWFRLEGAGRERAARPGRTARTKTGQPGRHAPSPGAARTLRRGAARPGRAGANLQTAALSRAPGRGLGARTHLRPRPAHSRARSGSVSPRPGGGWRAHSASQPRTRPPTMPPTHSHTYALRPARYCSPAPRAGATARAWTLCSPAPPPACPGLAGSGQRAPDPAWRASESAAEVTGEGKPFARAGRRPGGRAWSRGSGEVLGRLLNLSRGPGFKVPGLGRVPGGNCGEGQDSASRLKIPES